MGGGKGQAVVAEEATVEAVEGAAPVPAAVQPLLLGPYGQE